MKRMGIKEPDLREEGGTIRRGSVASLVCNILIWIIEENEKIIDI
jgi:hypothetical protein